MSRHSRTGHRGPLEERNTPTTHAPHVIMAHLATQSSAARRTRHACRQVPTASHASARALPRSHVRTLPRPPTLASAYRSLPRLTASIGAPSSPTILLDSSHAPLPPHRTCTACQHAVGCPRPLAHSSATALDEHAARLSHRHLIRSIRAADTLCHAGCAPRCRRSALPLCYRSGWLRTSICDKTQVSGHGVTGSCLDNRALPLRTFAPWKVTGSCLDNPRGSP